MKHITQHIKKCKYQRHLVAFFYNSSNWQFFGRPSSSKNLVSRQPLHNMAHERTLCSPAAASAVPLLYLCLCLCRTSASAVPLKTVPAGQLPPSSDEEACGDEMWSVPTVS